MAPRNSWLFFAVGLLLLNPARAVATGCFLDGSINQLISLEAGDDPNTPGNDDDFGGTDLCHGPSNGPHTVAAATGTNCVLNVFVNSTGRTGSATCLSIGKGVTVNMNEQTIACSGSQCGNAIEVTNSSSGTSNKVILNDGTITGCWTVGVKGTAGSDTTVTNFIVNLDGDAGSCPSGGVTGMSSEFKLIQHALVYNASGPCIDIHNGTLKNSIVHDCADGIRVGNPTIANVVIDNVADAGIEQPQVFGGGQIDLTDVVIRNAVCNFRYGFPTTYCSSTPYLVDLHGVNFWGDIIVD